MEQIDFAIMELPARFDSACEFLKNTHISAWREVWVYILIKTDPAWRGHDYTIYYISWGHKNSTSCYVLWSSN